MKNVDAQAPTEYKQARQAFAGPTQVYDAIEDGRQFFDIDARTLKKTYDALGASEKDGFAIGAYDAIRTKIQSGADGIDQIKRTFGSPEKRDQIKVLIGDDALSVERAITFFTFASIDASITFWLPITLVFINSIGLYSPLSTCFSAAA